MDNFGMGPAGLLRKDFSCREPSQKEFPCEGLSWSRRDREGQNGKNRQGQRGLPFYMTYPDLLFREEDAAARDLEYLIQMYPKQAGKYREKISRMLDQVDYRGSMIYDEYPDQLQLRLMCKRICERAKEGEEEPGQWFRDLTQVMVCQELCQRRAEYRRYRKTFYVGAGEAVFPVDVPERI